MFSIKLTRNKNKCFLEDDWLSGGGVGDLKFFMLRQDKAHRDKRKKIADWFPAHWNFLIIKYFSIKYI